MCFPEMLLHQAFPVLPLRRFHWCVGSAVSSLGLQLSGVFVYLSLIQGKSHFGMLLVTVGPTCTLRSLWQHLVCILTKNLLEKVAPPKHSVGAVQWGRKASKL